MKKITTPKLLIVFSLISYHSFLISQNVAINATGNQADPSAMLDVSSQTAGVLIPRMSTTSRNAISSPALGLQVFNTDCNELNYWNGACWLSTGSPLPMPDSISSGSPTALCANSVATYTVSAVTGATKYIWSVPAGAHVNYGQGTTSVGVTWGNYSGQICVNAYDACESSEQRCLDINISPIPPTPGNITGLASVYPGQTAVTYFIGSVSGADVYNWSVPSGATITAGAGTPAITVSFACNAVSGNISVTAGSNCGSSSPSVLAVTVTSYLAANSGSAVFGGTAIGGSPTASGGYAPYTYLWSPNTNLSSFTVANPTAQCSGSTTTYTLTITDANGCTATNNVAVTRNLTAAAGKNATICSGSSAVIGGSLVATGGQTPYSYLWNPATNLSSSAVSNPTASPTSTVTYTLTVTDAHGCTATSSATVNVKTIPATPGTITGSNSVCLGSTGNIYYISPVTNATSYNWTVPSGASITANSGTSITVTFGTITGNITVSATDSCGTSSANSITVNPVTATGGTITSAGGYTINTFTTSGTFTPECSGTVEVLVVAGGGGGGSQTGGGGGGGGVIYNASYAVTANTPITVTVGAGGLMCTGGNNNGSNGGNSVFGTLTAIGGGMGGSYDANTSGSPADGSSGGSGGGGDANTSTGGAPGGAGTSGQGYAGGSGNGGGPYYGGGGGGAGGPGQNAGGSTPGNGGPGVLNSISGSPVYYSGGGGGCGESASGVVGIGGSGVGANGGNDANGPATIPTPNSGGGGGGTRDWGTAGGGASSGAAGVVIISYIN